MGKVQQLIQELKNQKAIGEYLSKVESFVLETVESSDDQTKIFEAINLVLESDQFESTIQKLDVIDNLMDEITESRKHAKKEPHPVIAVGGGNWRQNGKNSPSGIKSLKRTNIVSSGRK